MSLTDSFLFFNAVSEYYLFLFLMLFSICVIGSYELLGFGDLNVGFILLWMEIVFMECVFRFVLYFDSATFLGFGFGFVLLVVWPWSIFDGLHFLEMIFF